MGLHDDDVFWNIWSSIIQEEQLPKLKQILTGICKAKHHRSVIHTAATEEKRGTTMAFTAINIIGSSSVARLTCSYCQKFSHDIISYFQLSGYPEWWAERSKYITTNINSTHARIAYVLA